MGKWVIWLCFWATLLRAEPIPLMGDVQAGLPAYEVADTLEAYGCAYATLRFLKPQTHGDLRSAVYAEGAEMCEAPEWLLDERQWMFAPYLPVELWGAVLASQDDLMPLPGLEAAVTPLFPQRLGRPTFDGGALYSELRLGVGAGSPERLMLALGVTPAAVVAMEDYRALRSNFFLQSGYIKAGYGWGELTVGKQALEFGDARHGSLLLSRASQPLPHIRLGVRPHILGSPFSFLGPLSFYLFVGDLGDSQFVSGAKVGGWMLGFRPLPELEIGVLNLNQFGGEGMTAPGAADYLRMFAFLGGDGIEQRRRRSVSVYLAARAPKRVKLYTQVYFDTLGEDPAGIGSELSFLGGVWFPRLGKVDLRGEFVQTAPTAYTSSLWGQGWAHRGSPLGHPLGPDGRGIYVDLGINALGSWRPEALFLMEQRGRGQATVEQRLGGGVALKRRWAAVAMDLAVRFARVTGQGNVAGIDTQLVAAYGQLRYAL